jgi:hypothetical protein
LSVRGELTTEFERLKISLDQILSPEVADFLLPQLSQRQFEELLSSVSHAKVIPRQLIRLSGDANEGKRLFTFLETAGNPACAILHVFGLLNLDKRLAEKGAKKTLEVLEELSAQRCRNVGLVGEAISDVGTYLLSMLILLSRFSVDQQPLLRTLLNLQHFGRATTISTSGTRRRSSIQKMAFTREPRIQDFLERLAANTFPNRINVEWMYKYIRTKFTGPMISEWTNGDSIAIRNVTLLAWIDIDGSPLRENILNMRHSVLGG